MLYRGSIDQNIEVVYEQLFTHSPPLTSINARSELVRSTMAVELAGKEGTVKALPMDNVPGLTLPSGDGAGRWLLKSPEGNPWVQSPSDDRSGFRTHDGVPFLIVTP